MHGDKVKITQVEVSKTFFFSLLTTVTAAVKVSDTTHENMYYI